MSLGIGTKLGPYEILAPVGAGGMGEVYRARDIKLGRDVALKVLPEAFAHDADRMARFEREAQVLASLNHPNIASIYGLEESDGIRALVIELVDGPTLAERIGRRAMPLEEALPIAKQIAEALEYAHEKGIIHRDLKPANVKLTADGNVKVLDFGLAKAVDESTGSPDPTNSPTLTMSSTRAGMILGTAAYMSPEQARGSLVDQRADIWAFGVVLHEMLTGKRLFERETVGDTLAAVLTNEPDLERVPAQARRLLRRCLEKDPKRRLRDIGEARFLLEDSPEEMPLRAKGNRGWKLATVVLGVAAISLGFLFFRKSAVEPRPISHWTMPVPASVTRGALALSRDGRHLAYTAETGGTRRIWVRMLDQREDKPILGTDGGWRPFFSPDGQWLAYFTGNVGALKKVPVTGGTSIALCEGATYGGGSWDEDRIVFSGSNGLMGVSASGGACETLTSADTQKGEAHRWPQILPGGKSVLFTISVQGEYDSARIAVLDLKRREYKVVANGGSAPRYVPSGHLVYVRGGAMFAVPFDLKRLAVTGPETPVIEGVFYNITGGFADYTFSDFGLLMYMAELRPTNSSTLEWRDRNGTAQSYSAAPQDYREVHMSPDGQRAAVTVGQIGGNTDIWIIELARGTSSRLTSEAQSNSSAWTPDGRLAFRSSRNQGIVWAAADGSGKPKLLLATGALALPTSWTPDGKTLLYTEGLPAHIWTLPVLGSGSNTKPQPLFEATRFNERAARISPDGRWVAYVSDESGKNQVYARPFPGPGSRVSISIDGGQQPKWSGRGRELIYWDPGKKQLMAVDIQTSPMLRAGRPEVLFKLDNVPWDVTPDGKRFLVVKELKSTANEARSQEAVVNWFEELQQKAPAKKK